MIIGYARISTESQHIDRQIITLKKAGAEKIFTDKITGTQFDRKEFNEMLEFARENDTLVFDSLDRLGRDYEQIKKVLTYLKLNSIHVKILDAPFLNFDTGNATLDSALFDMLTSLLSYIADNERKQMLRRQAEGIAVAKTKNVYKGKPFEYSATAKDKGKRAIYHNIVRSLEKGEAMAKIARENGVTRKVVYRIKNEIIEKNSI